MSYKQTVLGLNPVHFVHDNLTDEAGPNDLTAVGAVRHTTDRPGDGIPDFWRLDGVDDYLWAADADEFDITGEHTVVWWMRRNDVSAQINSASLWAKGNTTYQTRLNGDAISAFRYDVRGGTGGNEFVLQFVLATTSKWYMVIARYGGGFMQLAHVDDSDDSLVFDSTARTGTLATNDQRWTVGAWNDAGDNIARFWRGDIVPPIMFDYALSEAEILSIWEARNDVEGVEVANLFATGTQTIVDVVNQDDNTTDLHLSVADDPATPDDDTYVKNAVAIT